LAYSQGSQSAIARITICMINQQEIEMEIIRQGDVALVRIKAIPADAIEQPQNGQKLILALGEATGHHHRFEFLAKDYNVKLYVAAGGARYLDVSAPADLLHEEHSTARVGAGKYLLPSQVEYSPSELRRVAD
jgi:hypothetical protein